MHRCWHWQRAGLIFIHVPKSAGTSFSTPLYGRFLGHYPASQIRSFNKRLFESLPSFGVVRNPWDRCLSAYRFAKRPILDGTTPSIDLAVRKELEKFDTFENFLVEWLSDKHVNELDFVFREQLYFLADEKENILVNHVGRFEDMDELELWISEQQKKPFKAEHLNKSGQRLDYREYYTPRAKDIVSQVYRRDIELFDYNF